MGFLAFDQEFVLGDQILQLPASSETLFDITATFTSINLLEEQELRMTKTITRSFQTVVSLNGAPRLEQLFPIHGPKTRATPASPSSKR